MELPQRSLSLMNPADSGLLVIDVQEKLLPHIGNRETIVHNLSRLLHAAPLLKVPVLVTEQYPQGLGGTVEELRQLTSGGVEKSMFSCRQLAPHFAAWQAQGIEHLVLGGIETHVCVQQTCLDLLSQGFAVQIVVDAVGARNPFDHRVALQRMLGAGASWTTTEAVLFEWCTDAVHPQFKTISNLVKQVAPPVPAEYFP